MGNRFKEKDQDKSLVTVKKEKDVIHNEDNTIHNTQSVYTIKEEEKQEIRNKRIQIVVKPSLKDKLDYLVEHGYIKSVNDFANFLFEKGIEDLEKVHGFKIK